MGCPSGGLGCHALVAAWGGLGSCSGLGWNALAADLDGMPLWRHGVDLDGMPLWQHGADLHADLDGIPLWRHGADLEGMPLWRHGVDLDGMPLQQTWMECPSGRLGWDALV